VWTSTDRQDRPRRPSPSRLQSLQADQFHSGAIRGRADKSNILLIGRGVGKTLLAQRWPHSGRAIHDCDATTLTEAVRRETSKHLTLLQAADFNVSEAERACLYREIDKIARKSENQHYARRLGEGVQQALLNSRGTVASVPPQGGRKHPHRNTSSQHQGHPLRLRRRVDGLEKIIESRTGRRQIGFTKEEVAEGCPELKRILPNRAGPTCCLRSYPSCRRLPVTVPLDALDETCQDPHHQERAPQAVPELSSRDCGLSSKRRAQSDRAKHEGAHRREVAPHLEEIMTEIMSELRADDVREGITAECHVRPAPLSDRRPRQKKSLTTLATSLVSGA